MFKQTEAPCRKARFTEKAKDLQGCEMVPHVGESTPSESFTYNSLQSLKTSVCSQNEQSTSRKMTKTQMNMEIDFNKGEKPIVVHGVIDFSNGWARFLDFRHLASETTISLPSGVYHKTVYIPLPLSVF